MEVAAGHFTLESDMALASPEEFNLLTEVIGARVKAEALKSLEHRIQQEQEELQRRRDRAFQMVRWAGAGIVFLLSVIGWTQWKGIRSNVEQAFEKTLQATYLIGDSTSPMRRSIDGYVGEALISGKLLRLLAEGAIPMRTSDDLSPEERERIKAIVGDETTASFIFEAGLFVLANASRRGSDEVHRRIEQFFGELVAAGPDSQKYAWLAARDDRKQAVLFYAGSDYVTGRAVSLLKPGVSTALAEAVLASLANGFGGSDGIPLAALKSYCAGSELTLELRRACFVARLALAPTDAHLAKEFVEDSAPPSSRRAPHEQFEYAAHAWRVLDQILRRMRDGEAALRTEVALKATERLVDGFEAGAYFAFDYIFENRIGNRDEGTRPTFRLLEGRDNFSRVQQPVEIWVMDRILLNHILTVARQKSLTALAASVHATRLRGTARGLRRSEEMSYVRHELKVSKGVSIELAGSRRWTAEEDASLPLDSSVMSNSSDAQLFTPQFTLKVRLPEGEFAITQLPAGGISVVAGECLLAGCEHGPRRW